MHEMYGLEINSQRHQTNDLRNEFEKYKKSNNLDYYFTKNLDCDSRERVLNNVKELMQLTDWHYVDK